MLVPRSSRRATKTVKLEKGELTTTEAQEHFGKVAAGKLHSDPVSLTSAPQFCGAHVDADGYLDFSLLRILSAMKSLPSHPGCGPDLLPAELLKWSGLEGAFAIADVCGRMHLEEKLAFAVERRSAK